MRPTTNTIRRRLGQSSPYVCCFCQQKQSISTTFLQKQKEAKEQWAEFATEIRAGKRKSMLEILEERGLIHAIAGERNALNKLMIDKRIGAYCGVDPTAPSLHVGHMLPFMALFWMHIHGFRTISLIGGATAAIGDPTGRTTDRPVMSSTERKANMTSIHFQLKRIWLNLEQLARKHNRPWEKYWQRGIENNSIWWNNITFIEVLKLLGRGLRLGSMLSKDTVKTKMESGDGMAFSEFCYPIMQAWDWWRMYNAQGIQMQIGGSDQFGNIVAGIDAVKYIAKHHPDPDIRQEGGVHELNTPYGFTVPLLTTASGVKFGKSAGNAIWLDPQMTSLFDLYGFFVRTADADVERYLKLFTFFTLPEIQGLMAKHKNDPSARIPHHALAYEFVSLVHGETAAKEAESQHRSIFSKNALNPNLPSSTLPPRRENPMLTNQNNITRLIGTYTSSQLNPYATQTNAQTVTGTQQIVLPKSLIYNQSIARVLHAAGLVTSRSEGHRLAEGKGAYIGRRSNDQGEMSDDLSWVPAKPRDPLQTWSYVIRESDPGVPVEAGEEGLLILRVGKWKVRLVRIVSDEKYEEMEVKDPPSGWLELKATAAAARQKEAFETKGKLFESEVKEQREAHSPAAERRPQPAPERDSVEEDELRLRTVAEDDDWSIEPRQGRGKRKSFMEGFKESWKLGEQHMKKEIQAAAAKAPEPEAAESVEIPSPYSRQRPLTARDRVKLRYRESNRIQPPARDQGQSGFRGQGRGRTSGPRY